VRHVGTIKSALILLTHGANMKFLWDVTTGAWWPQKIFLSPKDSGI